MYNTIIITTLYGTPLPPEIRDHVLRLAEHQKIEKGYTMKTGTPEPGRTYCLQIEGPAWRDTPEGFDFWQDLFSARTPERIEELWFNKYPLASVRNEAHPTPIQLPAPVSRLARLRQKEKDNPDTFPRATLSWIFAWTHTSEGHDFWVRMNRAESEKKALELYYRQYPKGFDCLTGRNQKPERPKPTLHAEDIFHF